MSNQYDTCQNNVTLKSGLPALLSTSVEAHCVHWLAPILLFKICHDATKLLPVVPLFQLQAASHQSLGVVSCMQSYHRHVSAHSWESFIGVQTNICECQRLWTSCLCCGATGRGHFMQIILCFRQYVPFNPKIIPLSRASTLEVLPWLPLHGYPGHPGRHGMQSSISCTVIHSVDWIRQRFNLSQNFYGCLCCIKAEIPRSVLRYGMHPRMGEGAGPHDVDDQQRPHAALRPGVEVYTQINHLRG